MQLREASRWGPKSPYLGPKSLAQEGEPVTAGVRDLHLRCAAKTICSRTVAAPPGDGPGKREE